MRKQFFRAFIMFGLFITAAAGSAFAQAPEKVVVNVPFDFVVGDKTLAAGEYSVRSVSTGRTQAFLVKSADGRDSCITLTNSVQAGSSSKESKLVFRQYGSRYFLSQIWTAGANVGRVIPRSRLQRDAEREEVRASGAEPPVIIVTSRHQ